MKVMSFNVLCHGSGENTWKTRKPLVVDIIKKYLPDTFGLQESHNNWMRYLIKSLPEYDYVGVGRDNGRKLGEFSPVFYLKDKYEVVETGNFWLSETPNKPSFGWDAACRRICSYAVLKEKATGKTFAHYNTHLDHKGEKAQINGALMIADRADTFKGMPTVVTGDFNVHPDSKPYASIVSAGFTDARDIAQEKNDVETFHWFGGSKQMIDFVFVKNVKSVKSLYTITDTYDGKYPSDHYPVLAEVEL